MNDAPKATPASAKPELIVVMPVYNESAAIPGVIQIWTRELDRLAIPYLLTAYDDGSTDHTGNILDELARQYPQVRVKHGRNGGHGASILRGYREADSQWVFQVDSDDEMGPESFEPLWAARNNYDLLLGCRKDRESPPARRLITTVARLTIGLYFGAGLRDVNTPYRLIRTPILKRMLPLIPEDAFAPNVIISGLAVRMGLRIFQCEAPHQNRRTGEVSIVRWKLWKAALRSFRQTLRAARHIKKGNIGPTST